MAALTFQAAVNNDRTHTVTRSTDDAIGTATAAVIMDSTATKIDVMDALRACMRHVSRNFGKVDKLEDIATTGSDSE